MSTIEAEPWVNDIKRGAVTSSFIEKMQELSIDDVLPLLLKDYSHKFLDRRVGNFREVGIATFHRQTTAGAAKRRGKTHEFKRCILLGSKNGLLTSVSLLSSIRCRPSPKQRNAFELLSGSGASLSLCPDGYVVEMREEQKVSLTKDFLEKRGWLLDAA